MMKSRITAALILVSLLVLSASCSCNISKAAVLKVAASDSSGKIRGQADYVCDGKDDQKEIQAAIDSLSDLGGVVEILPGNYYKSSSEPIYIPSNIVLRMNGATINQADVPDATQEMVFANSDNVSGNSNITIEGGRIMGTIFMAINFTKVNMVRISDMEFSGVGAGFPVYGVAIKIWTGNDIIIRGNYIHDGRTGVYVSGSSGGIIENNIFYNQSYIGTEISVEEEYGGNQNFTVTGNVFDSCAKALLLLQSSHVSVVGNSFKNSIKMNIEVITGETANDANYNTIVGNTISGGSGRGINVVYSHHNTIADNIIEGITGNVTSEGIFLESSDKNVVTGNNLHQIGGHGISIGGNDNLITGNRIENASYGNPDVWSGIAVTGKNVLISNNMIRDYAGYAFAGVRIRSESQDCIVRGNDLRDSGTTYPLYDEGTGTIALLNIVD